MLADFDDGATRTVDRDGEEREVIISRVYPTMYFGFREITVERPLRLDFQASPERIVRLDERMQESLALLKMLALGHVRPELASSARRQGPLPGFGTGDRAD